MSCAGPHEGSHGWIAKDLCQFLGTRPLRGITLPVHQAEEPQRFPTCGLQLVPGAGRDVHHVQWSDVHYFRSRQYPSLSTQDHDDVQMPVPFQGGMAIRRDLEVAQLHRKPVASVGQDLTGNAARVRVAFLVGEQVNAFPAKVPPMSLQVSHAQHPSWVARGRAIRRSCGYYTKSASGRQDMVLTRNISGGCANS